MIVEEFLNEEHHALEEIGEVAAKVAYYNFDWRFVTLVMFNAVQHTLASETFLKYYNKSVIVKPRKSVTHHRFFIPQFVIFALDTTDVIETVLWLDRNNYDSAGKYIIICTSGDYKKCNEDQIFSTLSSVKIVNVIYMRGENDGGFSCFSYNIVNPRKCLSSEHYNIDVSSNCTNDECFKKVFPEKLNNFNKCPLIVSTFEQPPFMYLNNITLEPSGGDGDILKVLAYALNATLQVKLPEEGNDFGHYENGNWSGSLGDVFNDRVHISVCSLPLTVNMYGNFQISFVYNSMDIVWTATLPAEEPAWQKLLNPLQIDLRITLLFTFIVIVFIHFFFKLNIWRRIRKVLRIGPNRFSLFFYSWALFIGMPILRMPSNRSFLLVIYTWIWFSFVIKNAYQAALMGSLKKHDYLDNFNSFHDVLKANYSYGGLGTLRDYYADDHFIYDNWIPMEFDEANNVLDKISDDNSDFVLASNKEIIIEHLIDHNGLRHLQILPDKIVNSPTVMFLKKHSFLTKPIDHILSVLVEAGFCERTHAKYLRHKKYLFNLSSKTERRALTFENFKACMLLLVFGWVLATIFFIAEAYCGRLDDDFN